MARKAGTLVLLTLGSAIGLLGGGAPPAMAMSCQNTQTPAVGQALEDFDASVFCLINEQRASRGRPTLRPNGRLRRAAGEYATSMEAGRFFSHYGDFLGHPFGASPVSRLRQVGYIRPHYVWVVGENLHWTTSAGSTPAATVAAWMNSPEHRKYLLKPRFRDLGVAAVRGVPSDPSQTDGVTVATEYGFRDS
jgi:uncharacterized protein YkwD